MKVLMIGGTRFIGRAVVTDLVARGHEVAVMNRGSLATHPDAARTFVCDKADRTAFGRILTAQRWDAVIDTVLDAADLEFVIERLAGRIAHFIHTGSTGVYAPCSRVPARESDPLLRHDAVYNFGVKLHQDQTLLRAHHEKAFPGTSLRLSYVYGPGTVLLDGWGGREPRFFQMLRDGDPVMLPEGGRSLLHPGYVHDLVSAFGDALEAPVTIGQCYNIGGDRALERRAYVTMVAHAMGVEANLQAASPDEILKRLPDHTSRLALYFSCEHMCADIGKAHRDMGWRPTTPLAAGLADNVEWMRAQGHI